MTGETEPTDGHPLRRAFFWGALFGTLGVFAILLVPVFNSSGGGRDARKAEGEQLSVSARDEARIKYAYADKYDPLLLPDKADRYEPLPLDFRGNYFSSVDVVGYISPHEAAVYSIPAQQNEPTLRLRFLWNSGESEFEELGPFGWETP